MARVVHFEVPVDDSERGRRFYETVFGWQVAGWGEEPYWLATTGAEGETGIDGALIRRSEIHATPVIVIGVESVDDALARAEQAGGTVLLGKQSVPEIGYSAYLRDPEGNIIGLFEPVEGSAS